MAIVIAKQELQTFEIRLERINQDNKLNIDKICELLIWNDENYQ